MTDPVDPFFWQVARWLIAGVFAAGLWHKLRDPRAFAAVVDDYRLLPRGTAVFAAGLVVLLEGLVLAGLILRASARPAATMAIALLGVYGLAIAVNLARGRRDIDCGCLGPADHSGRHRLSGWLLARNAVLACVAVVILAPASGRELLWLDATGIAAGVVVGLLLCFTMDRLLANRSILDSLLR